MSGIGFADDLQFHSLDEYREWVSDNHEDLWKNIVNIIKHQKRTGSVADFIWQAGQCWKTGEARIYEMSTVDKPLGHVLMQLCPQFTKLLKPLKPFVNSIYFRMLIFETLVDLGFGRGWKVNFTFKLISKDSVSIHIEPEIEMRAGKKRWF